MLVSPGMYIKSPDEFDEYLRKGVHGGLKTYI
jgi:hypothetical protein